MKKTAKLINETPGKFVHHKQYLLDPPMNGYRHVLVTRVNRTVVISRRFDKLTRTYVKKELTLKHTLIQAATNLGENISRRLRKYEFGITAADALQRNNYTIID